MLSGVGVRVPMPAPPRRSKLHIACSDFFSKVRSHSFRCSSFPTAIRFAGFAVGFWPGTKRKYSKRSHLPKEGDRHSLSPSFGALPFCQGKRGRCGGLIEIAQENLDGFPAHTLSLRSLYPPYSLITSMRVIRPFPRASFPTAIRSAGFAVSFGPETKRKYPE